MTDKELNEKIALFRNESEKCNIENCAYSHGAGDHCETCYHFGYKNYINDLNCASELLDEMREEDMRIDIISTNMIPKLEFYFTRNSYCECAETLSKVLCLGYNTFMEER